jgi:hypothetical protein
MADYSGKKKFFMKIFAFIGSFSCMGLYFFTDIDTLAIGEQITLNGLPVTIVGVTAPGFYIAGATAPGFSLPMAFATRVSQGAWGRPDWWWTRLMARKKPAVTIRQVEESLQAPFRSSIAGDAAAAPAGQTPRLEALPANRGFVDIDGGSRLEFLFTISVVFGLLLVIVCLNVGNLLTARSAARDYEFGMRLTLGASRRRLIRQLLTESVMLAVVGGAMGVVLAFWGKDLLRAYFGEQIPLLINIRVLAFSIAVAAGAGILFGLVPAFRTTRFNLNDAGKRSSRNVARPRSLLNK